MRRYLIAAAFVAVASPAMALDNGFRCTNEAMVEVKCDGAGCTSTATTTATLLVEISKMGWLKVCVTEGCGEGGAASYAYPHQFSFFGTNMTWGGEMSPEVSVLIDTDAGIGTLIAGPYASPLRCATTE